MEAESCVEEVVGSAEDRLPVIAIHRDGSRAAITVKQAGLVCGPRTQQEYIRTMIHRPLASICWESEGEDH